MGGQFVVRAAVILRRVVQVLRCVLRIAVPCPLLMMSILFPVPYCARPRGHLMIRGASLLAGRFVHARASVPVFACVLKDLRSTISWSRVERQTASPPTILRSGLGSQWVEIGTIASLVEFTNFLMFHPSVRPARTPQHVRTAQLSRQQFVPHPTFRGCLQVGHNILSFWYVLIVPTVGRDILSIRECLIG